MLGHSLHRITNMYSNLRIRPCFDVSRIARDTSQVFIATFYYFSFGEIKTGEENGKQQIEISTGKLKTLEHDLTDLLSH